MVTAFSFIESIIAAILRIRVDPQKIALLVLLKTRLDRVNQLFVFSFTNHYFLAAFAFGEWMKKGHMHRG